MDKAMIAKVGVVSLGALALYYLLRNPTAGDTAATTDTSFYGGMPTPSQVAQLDGMGLLTPNDYSGIIDLPPYYGNNPGNQTGPTAVENMIDAISRQASGGSGPGCCGAASAPTTFTAPSAIQYQRQEPQVIANPVIPVIMPKVSMPSYQDQIASDWARAAQIKSYQIAANPFGL